MNEIELAISCSECVRRSTPDCQDCLVTFVLGETPDQLEMNSEDAHIIELFNAEGLLPRLRYRGVDAK